MFRFYRAKPKNDFWLRAKRQRGVAYRDGTPGSLGVANHDSAPGRHTGPEWSCLVQFGSVCVAYRGGTPARRVRIRTVAMLGPPARPHRWWWWWWCGVVWLPFLSGCVASTWDVVPRGVNSAVFLAPAQLPWTGSVAQSAMRARSRRSSTNTTDREPRAPLWNPHH